MMKRILYLSFVILMAMSTAVYADTVAYWDFQDGTDGVDFAAAGGSVDTVGGYTMYGYDNYYGPSFVDVGGGNLASSNADNHQDGYTLDASINSWSSSTWTIECSVYLEEISGWETIIGRDGSSQGEAESDFYLCNNGIDDSFRINVDTVGGTRWVLDGDYDVQINTWYAIAAMSDGQTLSLWLDDGSGYQCIGSQDISAQSVADNALAATDYNWTFGRGWYNGGFVDHIDGMLDNIRISDEALDESELLPVVPEPATMMLLGFGALATFRKRK